MVERIDRRADGARRQPGRADRRRRCGKSAHRRRPRNQRGRRNALGCARCRRSSKPGIPARAGGKAIANVLTGRVNPSGRLPVTFYASEAQLPRPVRPGGSSEMDEFTIDYSEGAAVGYKWVDRKNLQPLFPFGHGLSYTSFALRRAQRTRQSATEASTCAFTVRNTGRRAGQGGRPGLCLARSGRLGSAEAPRRIHEGRLRAGTSRKIVSHCRSALARGFRRSLAHMARRAGHVQG